MRAKREPSDVEVGFARLATSKGWVTYRSGWPDFLLLKDGKPCYVEVKSWLDRLQASQVKMFTALESTGVDVYVWWSYMPDKLLPWKKFARLRAAIQEPHLRAARTEARGEEPIGMRVAYPPMGALMGKPKTPAMSRKNRPPRR